MLSRTLRSRAERSREIARLTIDASCILQHTEEEPSFAEKTMLLPAIDTDMCLRYSSYGLGVVKCLQESIGIRVQDIGLEARILGAIVKGKVKVFDAELGVFDLDLPIMFRDVPMDPLFFRIER